MTEGLTQRERECLDLVGRGLSSKEIALELGISHHTVDLHLRRAMRALGKSSRREAARALLASAGLPQQGIQRLSTHSPDIADDGEVVSPQDTGKVASERRFGLPFLRQGREANDLASLARILWIAIIAVVLLVVIANFFNALGTLWTITG